MRAFLRHYAFASLVTVSAAPLLSPQASAERLSAEIVLEAWKARPSQISSYAYECSIDDENTAFHAKTKPDPFDAPQEGKPKHSVLVQKHLSWKQQGKNTACRVSGEHCDTDNLDVFEQDFQGVIFDEVRMNLITSSRSQLQGMGAFGITDRPALPTSTIEVVPIILWHNPLSYFNSHRIPNNTWRLLETSRDAAEGPSFVQLYSEQQHNKRNRSSALVTVMKRPPYLPVHVTRSMNGEVRTVYKVEYSKHAECHWKLDSWTHQQLNRQGVVETARRGTVLSFDDGERLPDSVFSISFPVGTHLIEYLPDGQRFWLQSANRYENTNERSRFWQVA